MSCLKAFVFQCFDPVNGYVYTITDRVTVAGVEFYTQADLTAWLTPFSSISYVQGINQTASDRRRDNPLTLERKSATEPLPQIPPLDVRVGLRFHEATKNPHRQVEVSTWIVEGQNRGCSDYQCFQWLRPTQWHDTQRAELLFVEIDPQRRDIDAVGQAEQ